MRGALNGVGRASRALGARFDGATVAESELLHSAIVRYAEGCIVAKWLTLPSETFVGE